ncbi:hypothetical protein [Agrobacterium sp. P15N1-A]
MVDGVTSWFRGVKIRTAYRDRLEELIGESSMPASVWDIGTGPMPDLPS